MANATALALRSPCGLWNIGLPKPGVFCDETALAAPFTLPVPVRQVPKIALRLADDRQLSVNGRSVTLPVGVGRLVRGDALKELAGIYRGMTLYLRDGGSARRVRDDDVLEIGGNGHFTAKMEQPQVTSVPRNLTVD